VPAALPALSRAAKLQKRAATVGFDWSDALPVLDKVREELDEVLQAMADGDAEALEDEVGDLLFAAVNLARHLKQDPENALRRANRKFERRFRFIEQALRDSGRPIESCNLDELDALWGEAKRQEKKAQKKQKRLEHKGQVEVDDTQQRLAKEAMAEKAKRDQELNRQQQEKAEQKARAAQIKQLIEATRLPKLTTEDYYNFVDDKKVKRIAVNALMRSKLSNGALAIVSFGGGYEVIPREAAVKIQERDPHRILLLNTHVEEADEDDPYAAYKIPDDLMW
jgi:uncharacterized protein YaiL (DUF2058 family)/phosphoribosyl-ATP pyrophosphohydrolase